jgi:predicted ATPase
LSRIDTLPIEAREILKSAAIIGSTFQTEDLEALLQAQKKPYLLTNVLEKLEAAQTIARTTFDDDTTYTFQQALMREIIYASQSFSLRRQTHKILAHHLEKKYRDSIDQHADQLAFHFQHAQEWLKAGQYRFRSAQTARKRFAYNLAANSYGQALAMFTRLETADRPPETITTMAQCHEGQGDMALLMNDMTSAAFAYHSAVNLLNTNQQPVPPDLQIKVAQTLPILGKAAEAETLLQEIMQRPLSAANLLTATATLTWLYWRRDADETPTWLNRTQTLVQKRPTDPYAAGISAFLTEWQGNLEDALEAYTAFEETAGIILTNCRLGDRSLAAGNVNEARKYYEAALRTAEREEKTTDETGLALAHYRMATLDWQSEGVGKAPDELERAYDDHFRNSLLFNDD